MPDLETAIQDEMESSGRDSVVPRLAVVGPRPEAVTRPTRDSIDEVNLPPPEGATPAPTARAAARERVRHQLQREVGVMAAGEEGRLRQERRGQAEGDESRDALEAAAAKADAIVTRRRSPNEPHSATWLMRANRWCRENPRGFAAAAAAVVLVGAAYVSRRI